MTIAGQDKTSFEKGESPMSLENIVETDVLVIGGGMAGCFAAIKAKERGVDVTLVDKGYVSKSGETPFAGDTAVFHPEWGHKLDAWMDQVNAIGEYINNREWNEIVFKDSYARYQDLDSWGVKFVKEGGEPRRFPHPLTRLDLPDSKKYPPLVSECIHWDSDFTQFLRKQAIKSGVKILDRITVAELLQQDGKIVGAIGIPMDSDDLYIFKAKATVISAGGGGFRPRGYPTHELTADGHAMAYRAGAEIIGKEFVSPSRTRGDSPGWPPSYIMFSRGPALVMQKGSGPVRKLVNAEGDEVPYRGVAWHGGLDANYEVHAGRAPLFNVDASGRKTMAGGGGAFGGMHGHATDGICPVNTKCATSVPGLYAAGDSMGTVFVGAAYSGFGFATAYASVSGARAGVAASEYALQLENLVIDEAELTRAKKIVKLPVERKGGFSPRWVTYILQNTLMPYYIMYIKHGERMQATLTLVEFIRDHLVPKLTARDTHELRLAHETKNMVLNAEMKLRASILRTESRGNHYREDYPRRDDPNWLAWVILKEEDGKMKAFKKPIPKEWWPDLSKPYEERYPMRFPGE